MAAISPHLHLSHQINIGLDVRMCKAKWLKVGPRSNMVLMVICLLLGLVDRYAFGK